MTMEEVEEARGEDELPMYQEHYNALFSMDFMDTKYPHVDTMKALGIFEDVELVLKNMHLAKLFSYTWNPTRSSLASSSFNEGEKRMVTFRQLGNLVWVQLWRRSKAAQIRSPVLRYVHKALANTFFARKATGTINEGELKFLDMGIKPILSRTSDGKRIRGDRSDTGNLMPFLDHLLTYKTQPTTLDINEEGA
ncbi:unnamed protein product [Microthlaspi erraticum]|uniref:Arabidopsis retrotransposon Orf1 C-terminal domain-containing protein n=1 Tax=Microthlaspi erraticum TaxID=1685480 RepID=A0A6D2JYC5_9BRAS|nr:unnamed protein product [Microthlaspi erraticum]